MFKPEDATTWSRYDVVGWGQPVRTNGWAPDGRWYGDTPRVLVDVRGAQATALIPEGEGGDRGLPLQQRRRLSLWPGPNSNTFIATVLRAVPELGRTLPSNAVGKDFRPYPYAGLTDSGTGVEASLCGACSASKSAGSRASSSTSWAWSPGSICAIRRIKLPGFGRLGIADGTALAAPAHTLEQSPSSRTSTSPQTINNAAAMRVARSGSFSSTTAINAPNSTLVSRNAATIAIGATVMAQIAMP